MIIESRELSSIEPLHIWIIAISVLIFVGDLGEALITYCRATRPCQKESKMRLEKNVLYESQIIELPDEIHSTNNQMKFTA